MNSNSFRVRTGKGSKTYVRQTSVRNKPRLNQSLTGSFDMGKKMSQHSFVLPPVISHRVSTSLSVQPKAESGYNPIAQVQAIPLTPQIVLKQFGSYLSKFELTEILDYKEINFLGMKANKIKALSSDNNHGYDDERSDYRVVINDHVAYRYEVQQLIGKGSFGQVCLCFDHKLKENVAIKIIRNQNKYHKQGRTETRILSVLKESSSESYTITMLNYFVFRKHICIVLELLGLNLYEVIKSNNFRSFPQRFVKKITFQLMTCLSHLKRLKVIHCDLKPENILMDPQQKTGIKVIDFGASSYLNEKMRVYIQSRFYRAPEIILGMSYNESIDVWSAGCILSELVLGFPLFHAESEMELLLCIIEVKGFPSDQFIEKGTKKKLFFDGNNPKILTNSRGKKRVPGSRPLEGLFKGFDVSFVNFIERNR